MEGDQRGLDGEYDATRDKDNKTILADQRKMIDEQDKQIEGVTRIVKDTKYVGQEFGTEVKKQNKQLENLNEDMDRVDDNMIEATSKMNRLLKKSNHCVLWLIIAAEVGIFILVALLL